MPMLSSLTLKFNTTLTLQGFYTAQQVNGFTIEAQTSLSTHTTVPRLYTHDKKFSVRQVNLFGNQNEEWGCN